MEETSVIGKIEGQRREREARASGVGGASRGQAARFRFTDRISLYLTSAAACVLFANDHSLFWLQYSCNVTGPCESCEDSLQRPSPTQIESYFPEPTSPFWPSLSVALVTLYCVLYTYFDLSHMYADLFRVLGCDTLLCESRCVMVCGMCSEGTTVRKCAMWESKRPCFAGVAVRMHH